MPHRQPGPSASPGHVYHPPMMWAAQLPLPYAQLGHFSCLLAAEVRATWVGTVTWVGAPMLNPSGVTYSSQATSWTALSYTTSYVVIEGSCPSYLCMTVCHLNSTGIRLIFSPCHIAYPYPCSIGLKSLGLI